MTERATPETAAPLAEVVTKAGLVVPASAVSKRRVVLGIGFIDALRHMLRRAHRQKVGFVLLCQDGCHGEAAICVHRLVQRGEGQGPPRTEYECGCTIRVIPGGL